MGLIDGQVSNDRALPVPSSANSRSIPRHNQTQSSGGNTYYTTIEKIELPNVTNESTANELLTQLELAVSR